MFAALDRLTLAAKGLVLTENGRPSLPSAGDALLEASFKLVRGLPRVDTVAFVNAILVQARSREDPGLAVDAFVLWASTRDIREGKGEKTLSHWMLATLAQTYPLTAQALFPLIPEYGSWRDVVSLLELPDMSSTHRDALLGMFVGQLTIDSDSDTPSLCGKWAPREKSRHEKVAKEIARLMFPEDSLPQYRRMLAGITKKMNTVESKMCGGNWADIKPAGVPARCLKIHRAAFMNESVKPNKSMKYASVMGVSTAPTVRSHLPDRIQCAGNFAAHVKMALLDPSKASVHGRVLHPHELVAAYMKSAPYDGILEAQWVDLRERLKKELPFLGKLVPMVDVSGSMSGTPMDVAIALGILISEVGAIRDRFLTFSQTPTWHVLRSTMTLKQKVDSAKGAHWGQSTNLQAAMVMLLEACVLGNVPPQEVGDMVLVILSDMQFDVATQMPSVAGHTCSKWDTMYECIVSLFKAGGLQTKWEVPYPVPGIIFWNLRAGTNDFPVVGSTPGVQMVSGFSANTLKLLMSGQIDKLVSTPETPVTPAYTLRLTLDDKRYDPVRRVCASVQEGDMRGYVFNPLWCLVESATVDPAAFSEEKLIEMNQMIWAAAGETGAYPPGMKVVEFETVSSTCIGIKFVVLFDSTPDECTHSPEVVMQVNKDGTVSSVCSMVC